MLPSTVYTHTGLRKQKVSPSFLKKNIKLWRVTFFFLTGLKTVEYFLLTSNTVFRKKLLTIKCSLLHFECRYTRRTNVYFSLHTCIHPIFGRLNTSEVPRRFWGHFWIWPIVCFLETPITNEINFNYFFNSDITKLW